MAIDDSESYSSAIYNSHEIEENESAVISPTDSNKTDVDPEPVNWCRWFRRISFLLVIGAIVVGFGRIAAVQTHKAEMKTFEQQYKLYAREITLGSFQAGADSFSVLRSLAKSITSHAVSSNQTFPLVSLPDWEVRTEEARRVSLDDLLMYAPLINISTVNAWQRYSVENQEWVSQGLLTQGSDKTALDVPNQLHDLPPSRRFNDFISFISQVDNLSSLEQQEFVRAAYAKAPTVDNTIDRLPVWLMGPAPSDPHLVNTNLLSSRAVLEIIREVVVYRHGVLAPFSVTAPATDPLSEIPRSGLIEPVLTSFEDKSPVAGFIFADVSWSSYFLHILPDDVGEIMVLIKDSCGNVAFTLSLRGTDIIYAGEGDLHDQRYNDFEHVSYWKSGPGSVVIDRKNLVQNGTAPSFPHHCEFSVHVYPSKELQGQYSTFQPLIIGVAVGCITLFSLLAVFNVVSFFFRYRALAAQTQKTEAIITSLFPSNIKQRVLEEAEEKVKLQNSKSTLTKKSKAGLRSSRQELEVMLDGQGTGSGDAVDRLLESRPIADLFPHTTVMFADIAGFTAWGSARDPSSVFVLLESVYSCFDIAAKKYQVYKVETIGDCYVAVTGLPHSKKDHAAAMVKCARQCLKGFSALTQRLESALGPDTADLGIRIGLHSGPVTAGVLRGERSRFQLFGDTVNTCARVESTGKKDMIHISKSTASELTELGKGHWFVQRADPVEAKGKGLLETFWIKTGRASDRSGRSDCGLSSLNFDLTENSEDNQTLKSAWHEGNTRRLVDWNVEALRGCLQLIVAKRKNTTNRNDLLASVLSSKRSLVQSKNFLTEVQEVIRLPAFDNANVDLDPRGVILGATVEMQLHELVRAIAEMYQSNPFHNFQHASHVVQSVVKLLQRIVAPDITCDEETAHSSTFGITSDPLTQFACVFSALIHDLDHPGVPNSVLVAEKSTVASEFRNRCVAEQNSLDLAFRLLYSDSFFDLRQTVFEGPAEEARFRHLVINSVIATDIMDPELKTLRNNRWNTAFNTEKGVVDPQKESDRKATIVIEHLIQASDIAHTMQHWQVYVKWNERLFHEMNLAYQAGRADKDPAEGWYAGELGFFDFYVIPLASKLKSCGVFGVSSDEYLNYANMNRQEWEARGKEMVASYIEKSSTYTKIKRTSVSQE